MSAQTPRQWFRIEHAAAEVAEVSIFDEISPFGVTAQDFTREIKAITAPVVNLHINSPGGDVYDGVAIYNEIKNHPATFHAYIPGLAASIATVIAMAADHITVAPHSRLMIHDAWAVAIGDAADMLKMSERLEATSQNIADIYAERAGGTPEEWRTKMRAESWFSHDEAVAVGLADEVGRSNDARPLKEAALFDLSRYRHGEREAARLRAEVADVPEVEEPVETVQDGEVPPAEQDTPVNRREARRLAVDAALVMLKV